MTVWNRTASGGWSASSTGQSSSSLGYGGSSSSKSSSSSSSSSSSTKTYTYTKPDGTKGTTTDYRHSDAAKAANAANAAASTSGGSSSGSSSSGSSSSGSSKTPVVTTAEVYIPSGGVDLSGVKVNSDGSISGATISGGSSSGNSILKAATLNGNIPTQTVTGNITPANFAEQGITVQVDRPDALAAREAAVAALAAQGIDYYKDLTAGQQSALITNIMHGQQDTTYIDNDSRSGTYQYATPGTPVTEETYNTLLGIQSTEPQNSPAVFAEAVQNYVDAGYTPTNIPTNPQPSNIPVVETSGIGSTQPQEIIINIPQQEDNTGDTGISDLLKSMFLMNLLGGSSGGGNGANSDVSYYPVETGTAGSSSGFNFGEFLDRYKIPLLGIAALIVVILLITKAPAAKAAAKKRSTKA